jgi:hypothetical protein
VRDAVGVIEAVDVTVFVQVGVVVGVEEGVVV